MAERTLIASQGEAWDELAVRAYGDGREGEFPRLMRANPRLAPLGLFAGGESVVVPALPAPPASDPLPPWYRDA